MRLVRTLAALAFAAACAMRAEAAQTRIAVAANFTEPAKEIAALFARASGHEAVLAFGATGQFYAQITQGAPFDALLSADAERPRQLVADGLAEPGSTFTYAIGRLALWSRDPGAVKDETTLVDGRFDKIAIANPASAPYGAAAIETMKVLGVHDSLRPKIVRGTSIAQTFQFVASGNAEVGFVALSQIIASPGGSRWIVLRKYHAPILQDAALLRRGADNEAAKAFLVFLRGPEARAVVEKFGYGVE